jgi:hypothetical protein
MVYLISVRNPAHPVIVGGSEITENTQAFCGSPADDLSGRHDGG